MNAFDEASKVEAEGMEIIVPWLKKKSYDGQIVFNGNGRLCKDLQKTGDIFFNSDPITIRAVEVKCEKGNKYNNFFLETWSNRSRYTPGWLITSSADFLFYYFLDSDELYVIGLQRLKAWAFHHENGKVPRIYKFPEKKQDKYIQLNDTWGCCVEITVIEKEVQGLKVFFPKKEICGEPA